MADVVTPSFVFIAPIAFGLVIGLVEAYFVHADESGLGWFSHSMHAIPTCIFFTLISMNVPAVTVWAQNSLGWAWLGGGLATYGIPVVIGIIAAVKVKAAAAIAKGGTVGESMPHALAIGALVALSPFVFAMVAPMLPSYLQM